jgi:hypothetical protein
MPTATTTGETCPGRGCESDKGQSQNTSHTIDANVAGDYTPPAGCAPGEYFKNVELAVLQPSRVWFVVGMRPFSFTLKVLMNSYIQ